MPKAFRLISQGFSSSFKAFEVPLLGLVNWINSITYLRMISATIVSNLRALHHFPVLDIPGAAFVTDPKLMALLDKVFKFVTNTTKSLVLLIGMSIKKVVSLWCT